MPRPAHGRPDDDDDLEEDEEEDDDEDEEADESPPRRKTRPARRSRHPRPAPPVRRWRSSSEEVDDEETASGASSRSHAGKKPIYWRARDSLFFEPLVALAIVIVLLVGLFAYTQNWPPVYVVESDSMQHGYNDQIGLINTGDLVLAQKVALSQITPYVTGIETGYSTYGEYGDVLLYLPNGVSSSTPVIHRAILYLQWDPIGSSYNATDLAGLPCGAASDAVYAYFAPGAGSVPSCDTTHLTGTLDLYNLGWNSTNISITLSAPALGEHSGFLTMGDNNRFPDQSGAGVPAISELVEPGWIVGVARGMIPWFGALKLLIEGQAGEVPPQSWQFLGLTVVGAILIAFGIHYALRTEGIETPLRREEEEVARAQAEATSDERGRHRWWPHRRRREEEEEEGEEATEARSARRTRPPPSSVPTPRGRPKPHVRRNSKPAKKPDSDEEL